MGVAQKPQLSAAFLSPSSKPILALSSLEGVQINQWHQKDPLCLTQLQAWALAQILHNLKPQYPKEIN